MNNRIVVLGTVVWLRSGYGLWRLDTTTSVVTDFPSAIYEIERVGADLWAVQYGTGSPEPGIVGIVDQTTGVLNPVWTTPAGYTASTAYNPTQGSTGLTYGGGHVYVGLIREVATDEYRFSAARIDVVTGVTTITDTSIPIRVQGVPFAFDGVYLWVPNWDGVSGDPVYLQPVPPTL